MRCLSYRLIKMHRKVTSAYLLCDKASLIEKEEKIVLFCVFVKLGRCMDAEVCFYLIPKELVRNGGNIV